MSNYTLSTSTPEAQGVTTEGILAFLDSLEQKQLNSQSFMILRHANVIAKGWWAPYEPASKRYVYSISKSFTSTAVGFAVADGLMSVTDPVLPYFPDEAPENPDDLLKAVTVENLLTMTSGNETDTLLSIMAPGAENWAKSVLAVPVVHKPGTEFVYNSGATYLLAAIVQKVTGQTMLDYLNEKLFRFLGIENVTWDQSPQGIDGGGIGIRISTEDLAKLGQFYLQKGAWNGVQLLPRQWVETATSARVRNDQGAREAEPADWKMGYGYQFWRCQHNAFRGDGMMGQFCIVLPDQDAVVVFMSEILLMQDVMDSVWEHLLPAMHTEALPDNLPMQKRLQERLASLHIGFPPASASTKGAQDVMGASYTFAENPLGIRSVKLDSPDTQTCVLSIEDPLGMHTLQCGIGRWERNVDLFSGLVPGLMAFVPTYPVKPLALAVQGAWTAPQAFQIRLQQLESPHADTLTFRFEGDTVAMTLESSFLFPGNPLYPGERTLQGTRA